MNRHFNILRLVLMGALIGIAPRSLKADPLGTAFTYQGQLKSGGSPANGAFNMTFRLFNMPTGGLQVGLPRTFDGVGGNPPPVNVTNGLFTVSLDFGFAYNGDKRWLDITVSGTTLSPRQELTAAPYARFSTAPWATNAANISNTNSGNVGVGTASPAQKLTVAGTIESTSGGFKFPDGTSQNTAATLTGTPTTIAIGWGYNGDGQLNVPQGAYTAVAAGFYHSIAIRSDGTLAGWGANFDGEITVPSGTFTAVAAGYDYSLGIRTDGTLAGWGYNSDGQTTVPAGTFTAVAAGIYHAIGLRTNGTLAGWGYNGDGQINVPAGTYTAVAAGYNHSLAVRSDGALIGWGYNGDGEITVPPGTYIAVAAGDSYTLAIRSDGTLVGFGYNAYGQATVPAGTYTAVAAGTYHGLAIRTDGTLAGWGYNGNGQSNVPSRRCTAFSAGDAHSLGVFPSISLDGGLVAGASNIEGPLSVAGQATITGAATVGGQAQFGDNVYVTGRLGVGTSYADCSLRVIGSVRARQGAPGFSGDNNNGFSFGSGNDNSTGMYSLTDNQLNFFVGASERMRVTSAGNVTITGGTVTMTGGNVGIGTTTPDTKLTVLGGTDTALAGGGYVQLGATTSSNISIDDNEIMARNNGAVSGLFFNHQGGNVLIADAGAGNVGIGTSNPAQRLHVAGNICATGSIGACSDARFKEHIEPVRDALPLVERLRPVRFDWKRGEFKDHHFAEGRQMGFIAQEIEKVLPQVVAKGSDGYLSVDYGRLTPVLVEAIKEEAGRVTTLEQENAALRARLDRLEATINSMAQRK